MASPRRLRLLALCLAALVVTACQRRADVGPVVVSVIGEPPVLRDPARRTPAEADRVLLGGVAQGLVRFDAAGQVEPGLAERWIVIDEGTSYIFRLRGVTWPDGKRVTAADVAAVLSRQLALGSRNPLVPFLTAIDRVVEMTPEVIEIELKRPRPDLLKLFAQPDLAIVRQRPAGGSGPFRPVAGAAPILLRPVVDPDRAADDMKPPAAEDDVRLIGESAARALLRYARGQADLVSGGTVATWPLIALSGIAPAQVRIDPAAGLFGLAIVSRRGVLADPAVRAGLGAAFDRATLTAGVSPEWQPIDRILPEQLDSAAPPAGPGWAALPLAQRRAAAARAIAASAGPRELRIALPRGPGATRLWGTIAATLIAVGAAPVRVAADDPTADLRLVDAVAPYDSARWYLATACVACGAEAAAQIEAARVAERPADRARAIAAADAALAADASFIALARPLRWSVVSPRLGAWQPNARVWHPLDRLRRGAD